MKNLNLKSILLLAMVTTFSVLTYGQHDHSTMKMKSTKGSMMKGNMMQQKGEMAKFNDENLNKAYMYYMLVNNALTNANTPKVKMMSKMLIDILNSYGKASDVAKVATKLAEASDVKEQRIVFAELTVAMEPTFKNNIVKGAVYKNFCPMANGKGAYWFSKTNTILNPYLGNAMPKCGSLKETITSM